MCWHFLAFAWLEHGCRMAEKRQKVSQLLNRQPIHRIWRPRVFTPSALIGLRCIEWNLCGLWPPSRQFEHDWSRRLVAGCGTAG